MNCLLQKLGLVLAIAFMILCVLTFPIIYDSIEIDPEYEYFTSAKYLSPSSLFFFSRIFFSFYAWPTFFIRHKDGSY